MSAAYNKTGWDGLPVLFLTFCYVMIPHHSEPLRNLRIPGNEKAEKAALKHKYIYKV